MVQTHGRAGGRTVYCHVTTKFSGMSRITYPCAPLLEIKTIHSDVQDGFPTIALLLVVAVFYNKNIIIYNVIRKAAVL